ncbi:MAG: SRPBCC family protein [Solirubrobacterales bacterium]
MRVEERIRIAAPRDRVWGYVSEPKRYAEFMVGSRWEPVPGEPTSGRRARFWLQVEVGSTDLGGVVELVEFDPPHELAWTNVSGIDNRGRWILREREGETEATLRFSYQVPGGVLALIASRLSKPLIARDVRSSLAALKDAVEGGPLDEGAA